jgi:hypothetical protein
MDRTVSSVPSTPSVVGVEPEPQPSETVHYMPTLRQLVEWFNTFMYLKSFKEGVRSEGRWVSPGVMDWYKGARGYSGLKDILEWAAGGSPTDANPDYWCTPEQWGEKALEYMLEDSLTGNRLIDDLAKWTSIGFIPITVIDKLRSFNNVLSKSLTLYDSDVATAEETWSTIWDYGWETVTMMQGPFLDAYNVVRDSIVNAAPEGTFPDWFVSGNPSSWLSEALKVSTPVVGDVFFGLNNNELISALRNVNVTLSGGFHELSPAGKAARSTESIHPEDPARTLFDSLFKGTINNMFR